MRLRHLRPVGEAIPTRGFSFLWARDCNAEAGAFGSMRGYWFPAYRETTYWLSSGKAALAGALSVAKAIRKCERPKVIIPAYACPDVVCAAEHVGVLPVPVDFVPGLPWLDPERVLEAITPETVAVIYLRFLGLPANDKELRAAIDQAGGPLLIEDSAHVFPTGSEIRTSADFVVLSFGRGKPVSVGIGGALIDTRSEHESKNVEPPPPQPARCGVWFRSRFFLTAAIRNWLLRPGSYAIAIRLLGVKADRLSYAAPVVYEELSPHMEPLLADVLATYLRTGDERERFLRELLRRSQGGATTAWTDLADECWSRARDCGSAQKGQNRLWRYPLLFVSKERRDHVYQALWNRGLGPSRMYEIPLTEMRQLTGRLANAKAPMAHNFAERLLTLPVHSDVKYTDYFRAVKCIEKPS